MKIQTCRVTKKGLIVTLKMWTELKTKDIPVKLTKTLLQKMEVNKLSCPKRKYPRNRSLTTNGIYFSRKESSKVARYRSDCIF